MNPLPRTPALALGALLALLALAPVRGLATERSCPGPSLDADTSFRARFPDLLDQLRSQLAARADLDPCARVELRSEGDTVITLIVTLPDGRAASRSVTRRDDVVPTLQALLLVPAEPVVASSGTSTVAPTAASSDAPPQRPAAPHRLRLLLRASPSPLDQDALPPLIHAARTVGVELSVLTGVRMGDGQIGVGGGALGFLEVHGWLLGFEGRADSYRPLLNGDPETALELALLAGRRFDFGGVALDLSAGPAVAMKGIAFSETRSTQVVSSGSGAAPPPAPAPPPSGSEPGSGPVPRLLLGARFGFSPRSVFRTFVGVDGAVGPRRVDNDANSASARLPAFSLGLALGATVGTP